MRLYSTNLDTAFSTHSLHFVHVIIIKYLVIYRAFKLSKDNNDKRNPVPTIDIIIQGKSNSDGNNNNNTSTVLLSEKEKRSFQIYLRGFKNVEQQQPKSNGLT